MEIEKLNFAKKKYGKELLIDCSLFSKRKVILRKNPFILDFYGIYIITNGEGSILLDNGIIPFNKGSLLFFQPNQVRQWQNVSSNFDGYFLVFEKEFIETFFQDNFFIYRFQFFHNNNNSYALECKQDFLTSLIDTCKLINTELGNLQEDSHHFLRSILYNILIQINRKFIEQYGLSDNLFQNNLGLQFKQLLEAKIRNYQRVEDYADFLRISRAHLNNISKKTFGLNISVLIKEKLLTEIKRELLFTNKSIKEISFEMNFSDISNFIRFFKKYTGIKPNEYRLKYTK
ncbi:MAG: helix-turn-helix domain-containing protein [Bacteroidales bacterium]|nr:helix-turn-helix domain-containing protein [Bacteroidales bacterium]